MSKFLILLFFSSITLLSCESSINEHSDNEIKTQVKATSTPTPAVVPTSTPTPAVVSTSTPTPAVVPTSIPTPTVVPTSIPTPTVVPTSTSTPTVVPTSTSTPTVVPTSTLSNTFTNTITIYSESVFSVEDIKNWTEKAVSNITIPVPDILGVIWSIGNEIGSTDGFGAPFNKFTQTVPTSDLNNLADNVDYWIDSSGCDEDMYRGYINRELKQKIRVWIEGSYDASTAPFPCKDSRIALVAANTEQTYSLIQKIYLHELYHVLQPTLWDGCQTMGYINGYYQPLDEPEREAKFESARWIVEGTAEYFANIVQAQINGLDNPVQTIFESANIASNESLDINNDIALAGAAAIRLLIENGILEEIEVLSGSMFAECDWVDRFTVGSSLNILKAKNNWHQFEKKSGVWEFKSSVLN